MSAEFEVQKGLYDALSAIGLTVYDVAPQATNGGDDSAFPYVEVGTVIFAPWDDAISNGHDFVASIHTRSRSSAMRECKEIQGRIYSVLHTGQLTLGTHRLVLLRRETSTVMRMADGGFHGVCDYRGLIEQMEN